MPQQYPSEFQSQVPTQKPKLKTNILYGKEFSPSTPTW